MDEASSFYYQRSDGQHSEEVPASSLLALLADGTLGRTTLICADNWENWSELGECGGLIDGLDELLTMLPAPIPIDTLTYEIGGETTEASIDRVIDLIRDEVVTETTMVWAEGLVDDWTPLGECSEHFAGVAAALGSVPTAAQRERIEQERAKERAEQLRVQERERAGREQARIANEREQTTKLVEDMSVQQLAEELDQQGFTVPSGCSLGAMQVALTSHLLLQAQQQPGHGQHAPREPAQVFDEFDRDGNGSLDRDEIALVCASLGDLRSEDGLDEVFELIDVDGDGTISREEFESWWRDEVAPDMEINVSSPTAALHASVRDGGGTRSGSPVSSPLKSPEAGRTFSGSTTVGLPPPDRGQSPGGSKVRAEEETQLGLLPPSIDVWLKGLRNTPAWRAAVGGYIARFKDEDIDMDGVGNKYYVITDAILKDDLGVGKVGHRATILAACVPQLD